MRLPEKYTPHKYQVEAIQHVLSTPYCGLFLPPGLGKTSSILAACKVLRAERMVRATLIVAPLRVMNYTWRQEAEKWLDFEDTTFQVLHGKDKDANLQKKADIYLINFEGLLWLLPKLAKTVTFPFDMLVVDESTKLKAYDTRRFRLLKPLLGMFNRRVILTGTPAPNSMMDLFAQAYIVDQGKALGKYITHFRAQYFEQARVIPGQKPNSWDLVLRAGAEEEIRKQLEPLVYTHNGEGYIQDQTPVFNDILVDLPLAARKQYNTMERILMSQVNGGVILAANAAVASAKCRQIANGHLYVDDYHNFEVLHDEKLDVVEDLLEELSGQPTLIWYEYKSDLVRLLARFSGEVLTATSPKDIVDRWNAKEIPVLYVHHQSAAHGLNLQFGGHVMIYYSVPWSGEGYQQGIKRLARQGQTMQVIVHRILAKKTVDEAVVKALALKEATQEDMLQALREYWATREQEV